MPSLKKNDQFVVAITDTMTDVKLKVLNFLYAPIMGSGAVQLYTTLISFVKYGTFESETMNHQKIFQIMDLKQPQDFIMMRESLEALGLLDVYHTQDTQSVYLYLLKEPLHPYEFFKNDQLAHLLSVKIGKSEYDQLISEFLTYKYDITHFDKITKSFDEVYGIVPIENKNMFDNWWASATNNGIVLKNRHFDFNHLDILVRARDLLDEKTITSEAFYQEINNLSYMYGFTEEELADIIVMSLDNNRQLNYEKLKSASKFQYDHKDQPVTIKRQVPEKVNESNQMIKFLEQSSPNEIIKSKYGTDLTSVEIEMFDDLRKRTGLSVGVINVLILYITTEKNGEIPNLNYFLRVANTWKRLKIQTTEDAYNHINKGKDYQPTSGKKEKPLPDWYHDYITDLNQKTKENKTSSNSVTFDELLKGFEEKK